MSGTRKVLRLGKSHDMIESALKSIHLHDHFLRHVLTCSSINQAGYLLLDNLLWLNSLGIVKLSEKRVREFNEWSYKFWLYATLLYLARDLHGYLSLFQATQSDDANVISFDSTSKYELDPETGVYKAKAMTSASSSSLSSSSNSNNAANRQRRRGVFKMLISVLQRLRIILFSKKYLPLHLDTLKNIFDIFLPLSILNFIKLSPGMQGFCGLVSSLISLMIVWDSKLKLNP